MASVVVDQSRCALARDRTKNLLIQCSCSFTYALEVLGYKDIEAISTNRTCQSRGRPRVATILGSKATQTKCLRSREPWKLRHSIRSDKCRPAPRTGNKQISDSVTSSHSIPSFFPIQLRCSCSSAKSRISPAPFQLLNAPATTKSYPSQLHYTLTGWHSLAGSPSSQTLSTVSRSSTPTIVLDQIGLGLSTSSYFLYFLQPLQYSAKAFLIITILLSSPSQDLFALPSPMPGDTPRLRGVQLISCMQISIVSTGLLWGLDQILWVFQTLDYWESSTMPKTRGKRWTIRFIELHVTISVRSCI